MNRITLIICLLLCSKIGHAQKNDSVFTPLPVTIFEDNFLNDSVGTFPKHWWIMHPDSAKYKKFCRVRNIKGKKALIIPTLQRWLETPLLSAPSPRMRSAEYLPVSFTLEYDFLMGKAPVMALSFFATHADDIFDLFVHHNQVVTYSVDDGQDTPPVQVTTPRFSTDRWHHLALYYKARRTTCYLDGKKVFTTPALIRDPYKFTLEYNAWDTAYGSRLSDTIAYTNFRLTTDNYSNESNFNRILTEHTFITHAIHFDVNKSSIKQESIAYMKHLADWLKQNPAIKLEIDGHTDSDGDANANIKLSKDRADEVKKQLVSLGVKTVHLTTKGLGDTKPIKPNTTPEGKAENRRVEFIKK